MLRASWQLLRPGGRLAFFTIFPTPGLDRADYLRAVSLGPRAAATRRRDHDEMLATAGFEKIRTFDLTDEFRRVSADLREQEAAHEDALLPAVGSELFYGRQIQLEECIEGVDAGLLKRALFVASRPSEKD